MTIPNLAGVVAKEDVFRKGVADYVPWARIANHLHTKAPGWEFHLKPTADGCHVWTAPDGSGYVVSYFTGPDDQATPDFVFPCQDHRNQPIPFDKVSCRVLTDTHRRALCANAAFTFGLGYELWAKEELESAKAPDPEPQPNATPKKTASPAPAPQKAAKPEPSTTKPAVDPPLSAEERQLALDLLKDRQANDKKKFESFLLAFRKEFNLDADASVAKAIQEQKHVEFATAFFA